MNTLGNKLKVTVFGQSHAPAIGCVVHQPEGERYPGDPLRPGGGQDLRRAGSVGHPQQRPAQQGLRRAQAHPPALPR